jgi:NDP-sugar pyrophosphorylase family protein
MLPVAILAGGLATRLGPLTESVPKALVPICGEPFLAHQLRLLRRKGIERVVLCVGHRGAQIREFAGDGRAYGLRVEYSFDGPTLLGTAGALKKAAPQLGDEFFVLYGDSYLPCDYAAVEEAFHGCGKSALMTVFRNEGQWDYSNVEFSEGEIRAYDKDHRASAMRHIDYGLGVVRREPFDALAEGQPADLAGLYQDLLRRGQLAGYELAARFYEIGSAQGIRDLEEFLSRP